MTTSERIVSFGPVEDAASHQLARCLDRGGDEARGVLCADHHKGYSMPIGGVLASRSVVMPAGVGYDIACENCAVRTNLQAPDTFSDLSRIMDEIWTTISFGVGRSNAERVDHPVFDAIAQSHLPQVRGLIDLARNHGAGRVMGRLEAKGKWKRGECVRPGKVDWRAALADLETKGIELRGGGADEAPGCYKRLSDGLAYHGDTIKVLHTLRPIGVAMAGHDIIDPYRD